MRGAYRPDRWERKGVARAAGSCGAARRARRWSDAVARRTPARAPRVEARVSPRPRAHLRRAGTTPEERRERIEAAMERRTLHGALFGLLVFFAVGGTLYYVAVVRRSTDFRVLGACVVVPVIVLFALYEPYLWFVQRLTGADPSADVGDASSAAARRRPRHPLGRGRVAGAVLCACAAAFFVEVLRLGDHWPELFALTLALPMLVFLLYRPVAALWTRRAGRDS